MKKNNNVVRLFYSNAVNKNTALVDEQEEFQFKDETSAILWDLVVESRDEFYNCCINFARHWAKMMQHILRKDRTKSVAEAAETALKMLDDDVTGIVFAAGLELLHRYWAYGDELYEWYLNITGKKSMVFFEGLIVNPS